MRVFMRGLLGSSMVTMVALALADGEHAGLEAELVGRLPAHQRHDAERAGLQVDLRHHAVAVTAVMMPVKRLRAEARACGNAVERGLGRGSGSSGSRSAPAMVCRPPSSCECAACRLRPAPHRVVAHAQGAALR